MREIKKMKFLFILGILACSSNQSKPTNSDPIITNCSELKKYSYKAPMTYFSVDDIEFKTIQGSLTSTEGFSYLQELFADEKAYFYSHLEGECLLIFLTEGLYDNDSEKLVLVALSATDKVSALIILAEGTSYPGFLLKTESFLSDNRLSLFRVGSSVGEYIEEEDRYRVTIDSVRINYEFIDGFYREVFRDSVRFER